MFKIDKLSCGYGQSQILHDLELDVAKREIVAVMGRNGMGKTTLFKSLMGILPQWQGQVSVDGHDVSGLETHERVARGIAYVPQGRMIFPSMSVLENIQTGLPAAARGRVPEDLYALFPVLYDMRSRKGGNLSGGSNSNWRLPGRWRRILRCCCWMSRLRGFSLRSSRTLLVRLRRFAICGI